MDSYQYVIQLENGHVLSYEDFTYDDRKRYYYAQLSENEVYARLCLHIAPQIGYNCFELNVRYLRSTKTGIMGRRQEERAKHLEQELRPVVMGLMKTCGWIHAGEFHGTAFYRPGWEEEIA